MKPPISEDDLQRAALNLTLAHSAWFWRVLAQAHFYAFLIPFPLPWVIFRPFWPKAFHREFRKWWSRSSIWPTLTVIAFFLRPRISNFEAQTNIATEIGKLMFTATFLNATLLSLSVALPGQSVLKAFITQRPKQVVTFAAPFLWALLFGLLGGTLLLGYRFCPANVRVYVTFIGFFAAFAILAPLFFVVRLYLLGLVRISQEEADKG